MTAARWASRPSAIAATRTALASVACVVSVLSAACTGARGAADRTRVEDELRTRAGQAMRPAAAAPSLPPGVIVDDGLTPDEAVAIALWNSPTFEADLADLGIARAEVQQAGLLKNPVLTLLLPWGPKQLEATIKWPIDALWQRPKRLAAARVSADAVAQRLVASGLTLIADTKLALVDLDMALERARLLDEDAQAARHIATLVRSRFDAGDISELESSVALVDADRVRQDALAAAVQITLARNRLHQLLGVGDLVPAATLRPAAAAGAASTIDAPCGEPATLERDAMASRPDVRAAELDVEAAGQRLGWEKTKIFSFIGVLDANAKGTEGFEMGPGLETDFGLIDRNQAGVTRAHAELARATARYREARQRVTRDVGDAYAQVVASRAALRAWRDDIGVRLTRQAAQTERAYEAGELSYLSLLEARRRLTEGRVRELTARTDVQRALVSLERSIGTRCTTEAKP